MSPRRVARDRDGNVVEGVSDGRRSTFDGNYTRTLTSWLIPFTGSAWEELDEDQYNQLMDWTVSGHLSWCVFPIDNL